MGGTRKNERAVSGKSSARLTGRTTTIRTRTGTTGTVGSRFPGSSATKKSPYKMSPQTRAGFQEVIDFLDRNS
jgi:hypothetical protein